MTLRRLLRTTAIAACIAATAAPPGFAQSAGEEVRVGQADKLSRVELVGLRAVSIRREGQDVVLTLPRGSDPDLSLIKLHPPKYVKAAAAARTPAGLELRLTLEDHADAKFGQADGAYYLNLFPTPDAAAVAEPPPRPDPRPASGVVRMAAETDHDQLFLRFAWAAPAGAAVFRRGEGVWVVFDTPARLDLSQAPANSGLFRNMRAVQGDGFTAVRIAVSAQTEVRAVGEGAVWTLILGPGSQPKASEVTVARQSQEGRPSLRAALAGATKVVWIDDPVVGDRIAAVTALAPSKGLPSRREFIDMALLPSMQGLAVEPIASDIAVAAQGDMVSIGRPTGLTLSSPAAIASRNNASAGLPQPASMPAVVDFARWSRIGSGSFLSRYDALQDAVADEVEGEAGGDRSRGLWARMGLARFLAGSELSFEAIGVLDMIAKRHPEMLDDPEFRGLRGAAKAMAGRYKEAQVDLSAPALGDDPSAALWRGYAAAQLGQWQDAQTAFRRGRAALNQFPAAWQARFGQADAESALRVGDLRTAHTQIALALAQTLDPMDQLGIRLMQARLFQAEGSTDAALAVFDAVARAPSDSLSTRAILYATQIRLARGAIKPEKAAAVFDGLRYRWRGDSSEMEIIRSLGGLYLDQGRYREALEVLRSAGQRMPDDPETIKIQADLSSAFRALFLEGRADGLEPVQALALFYDFRELTPIGADGDLMVRKLASRLVNVDLLDRAAELLKYQVDNRLDGVPRAIVATDLATLYLMNRKPEAAIDALNDSRTTALPAALANQRRLIEARAWLALNQPDHAAELIGKDNSPEALDMRAEITWRSKDWAATGAAYELALGDRWSKPGPLAPAEESELLRAGVAFSLASDEAALDRLRARYGALVELAHQSDALRVALTPLDGGEASPASFSRLIAQDDAFAGWVAKMKQRFREPPRVSAAPGQVASAAGQPTG